MFEIINLLITTHYFSFQSWSDNGRTWVCIGPAAYQLDDLRDAICSDSDTIENNFRTSNVVDYITSANWLPMVSGYDFLSTMSTLEKRLEKIPKNMLCISSLWSNAIFDALEKLYYVRHSLMGDSENIEKKILRSLPPTFTDINWAE